MSGCIRDEQIQDYVDGSLPAGDRAVLEEHLAGCETCRRLVDRTRALHEQVGRLPRTLEPQRDLWAGVARRIGSAPESRTERTPAGDAPGSVRGFAYVIAAVLVLCVAVVIYGVMMNEPVGRVTEGPATSDVGSLAGSPLLVEYRRSGAHFDRMAGNLEEEIEPRRQRLSPRTRAVIDRNLAVIDAAIHATQQVLAENPRDVRTGMTLQDMQKRRIELLEWARQISSEEL